LSAKYSGRASIRIKHIIINTSITLFFICKTSVLVPDIKERLECAAHNNEYADSEESKIEKIPYPLPSESLSEFVKYRCARDNGDDQDHDISLR
jgi:hypothetical protein